MPKSANVIVDSDFSRAVYQLAIAQALGFDIDKSNLTDSLAFFDMAYEASTKLRDYNKTDNFTSKKYNKLLNEFLDVKGIKPSMHVLEALASLNGYSATKPFKSASIGIETDGITNGYAIAQMQFLGVPDNILDTKRGPKRDAAIVKHLTESFARIGVMVGTNEDGSPKTMEQFIQKGELDVYQALAKFIRDEIDINVNSSALDTINEGDGRDITKLQMESLTIVHGKIWNSVTNKVSSFGRSLAKNPLMISGYGAEILKIINALGNSISPIVYDKLAELQIEKNEGKNIEEDLTKYLIGLNSFIPGIKSRIEKHIKDKGDLREFELSKNDLDILKNTFTKIFKPAITTALDQFTTPLKKSRDAIIKSGEIQYTAFKYKYDEAIQSYLDKTGKKTAPKAIKNKIAEELAPIHMPLVYGPWSEGTALQIIKDVGNVSNKDEARVDIRFKAGQEISSAVKEGPNFIEKGKLDKDSITSNAYSREYATPGVSTYSNTIQNIDSVLLGEAMEKNPEVLAIFDALMSNVTDAVNNNDGYNESFRETSADFSVIDKALDRLLEAKDNLDSFEISEIEKIYKKESFEAKALIKKIKDSTNDLSRSQDELTLANLGFDSVADLFIEEQSRIQEMKNLLAEAYTDNWLKEAVISQMYVAESIKDLVGYPGGTKTLEQIKINKAQVATSQVDPKNANTKGQQELFSLDNSIEVELAKLWDTDSLKTTAQNIFNRLGDHFKIYYPNVDERNAQQSHLQRVLDEIIIPTGTALDNVTVELLNGDIKATGVVSIGENNQKVQVILNDKKPKSFSEQTAQEVYLHELIHVLTVNPLVSNTSFRTDILRIRKSVKKELEKMDRPYETFLHKDSNGKIITLTDAATEIASAKEQYNYLFGETAPSEYILDEFLAYSLTNKHLVRQLSGMPAKVVPLWNKDANVNVIEKMVDFLTELVNRMTSTVKNKKRSKTVDMEIFNLTKELVTISHGQASTLRTILQKQDFTKKYDDANQVTSDFLKKTIADGATLISDKYIKGVDKLTKDGKISNFFADVLYDSKLAVLMTSSYGKFINNNPKLQRQLDRTFQNFKPSMKHNIASLRADVFGGIPEDFIRLLYKSQKEVDQARSQYKELTKDSLINEFKDLASLTDNERQAITRVLLKSDFSILEQTGAYTMDDAIRLLSDGTYLQEQIDKYAVTLDVANNKHYAVQTDELANFMMKGNQKNRNQYKNAHLIFEKNKQKSTATVTDIDVYVTLLALQKAEPTSKDYINSVVSREFGIDPKANGITNIIYHHMSFKEDSLKQGFGGNPTLMQKGYIATITNPNIHIEFDLKDAKTQKIMTDAGYEFVSGFETITGLANSDYGMYVIRNLPDAIRTKGIASVTSKHYAGTSCKEILGRNAKAEGEITALFKKWRNSQTDKENTLDKNHTMMPIVNEKNEIVDYSIHMNHALAERLLEQELSFDQVLPTMYSHQQDKVSSEKINKEAIDLLFEHTNLNYEKSPQKYVNILEGKYKQEYFDVLPVAARNHIRYIAKANSKKGKQVFYVENKLLDTVFGYKMPSIGNLPIIRNNAKAQKIAKVSEKVIMEMVALAKVNIVIKIPAVLGFNILSNMTTSVLYGVPLPYVIKKWREGFKELERYQKDAKEFKLLELKQIGNPSLRNSTKIKLRKEELVTEMKNNKVSKLIDMGLFNSITEDINRNDFTYRHQSMNTLKNTVVGKKFDNLFKGNVVKLANQAYIGEETAFFKTMMHATQASDFIARYAMYTHSVEVKKIDESKAFEQMVETFVNYDQPLNKYLQYGNDVGLLFFIKYYLRIQRATFNIVKEKPLNVGMLFVANTFLGLDFESIMQSSVLAGNFFPTGGGPIKVLDEIGLFGGIPGLEVLSGESLGIG